MDGCRKYFLLHTIAEEAVYVLNFFIFFCVSRIPLEEVCREPYGLKAEANTKLTFEQAPFNLCVLLTLQGINRHVNLLISTRCTNL